jgi:hypothetical protein
MPAFSLGVVSSAGCSAKFVIPVADMSMVYLWWGRMADPPMREPTYFVLAALLRGPLHGYAIMKRAEELSGGRSGWRPGPSTRRWTV